MTPSGTSGQSPPPAQSGPTGAEGPHGSSGTNGRPGPDGRANVKSGDPKPKFSGLGEVTVL